jgi:hypothetical protein
MTTMVLVAAMATTAVTASAQQRVTVKAMIGGHNEVPGVSTGAHGVATVTVDRGAGRVDYQIDIFNLPTGIVGAHIHVGPLGVNGPIIFGFPIPAVGQSGAFQLKGSLSSSELQARATSGIHTFDDAAFAIASGAAYVNVHTQAFQGGEIRGQLCPASAMTNVFNGVSLCSQ